MFKRTVQRYGQTPEPVTPFQKAAQLWDERIGASRVQVVFHHVLPLAMPGVLAAIILGFARSIGEFGATITFVSNIPGETRTLPLAIYTALQVPGGESVAARLAVISVLLSLAALAGSELLSRRIGRRGSNHVF